MAAERALVPAERVWRVTTSVVAARALHVVAEMGVADHLDEGWADVAELAERCGVRRDALDRVLRLLAAHGIFDHGGGRYRHTEASRMLRDDHPQSMRAHARLFGLPLFWSSFGDLAATVRSGTAAAERLGAGGLWEHLRANPEEARVFDAAMMAKAHRDIADVLSAYDFSRFATIADIGGGRGHLLRAVLDSAPDAHGALFDLPDVIQAIEVDTERMSLRSGDFFADPLPDADAYVLMDVIHDWADAEALAIFTAVRRAARPGAVALVVEGLLPGAGADTEADAGAYTLDVVMLTITGGRERTAAEMARLLQGAGFELTQVIETQGRTRIVEAVAT